MNEVCVVLQDVHPRIAINGKNFLIRVDLIKIEIAPITSCTKAAKNGKNCTFVFLWGSEGK